MRTPPGPRKFGPGRRIPQAPLCGEKSPHGEWGKEETEMPGKRQPTDVIKANGRKHLSRAEEAQRRAGEVNLSTAKTARPPSWLPEEPKELKKSFRALGRQLIEAKLFTELDRDTLGPLCGGPAPVGAGQQGGRGRPWNRATRRRPTGWSRIQDRYFKARPGCANDMGLTVTSRCRLVVPGAGEQEDPENQFLQLIQGGASHLA